MRVRAVIALPIVVSALACNRDKEISADSPAPEVPAPPARVEVSDEGSFDILRNLRNCDVKHRGILLDVGSRGVDALREYGVGPFDDVPAEERGGATFGRVLTKRLAYRIALDDDAKNVVVSIRGTAGTARYVSAYLDDKRLGAVQLPRDDVRVVTLPALDAISKGPHSIILRFAGSGKTTEEPYALIDWIRIGVPDEHPDEYAAPTLRQLVTDVVLEGKPKRAIVLRAPSTVRCTVRAVPGSELKLSLGYWGNGKGVAEVRVVEDGEDPVVLKEAHVSGGHGTTWSPLRLKLDEFAPRVIGVELRAIDATGGGRVAFGEPVISANDDKPLPTPQAKIAVVVVGAGLDRSLVPPWGSAEGLTAFAALARDAAVFDWYRAPTTVASGVMASLVTGMTPRGHSLEDPLARLPNEVRAIGELVKEASGRTAMLTGVPTTFPNFGFDRGWDDYEWYSPVQDIAATEPLTRATAWLKEQLERDPDASRLVVIHVRGGHPPWDLTREEAARLPPDEYAGPLEPRRGAIVLAGIRGHGSRADRRLTNADWVRLRALEGVSFQKQNTAFRELIELLQRKGVYDSTLFVFMGDVATGDASHLPFAAMPELSEGHLVAPLIVKFPKRALAGKRVPSLVTTVDVTRTILDALHLQVPEQVVGLDLFRIASGYEPSDGRPHTATLGSTYATRWGPWLLRGELRRTPVLCQLEIDPACAHDVLLVSPMAAQALWRQTFESEMAARGGHVFAREPAVFDAQTQAALKVFGYSGG